MLAITTTFEHTGHWIKMRQSLARFSGPESSPQIRSLADFIATTSGFSFSVHTRVLIGVLGWTAPDGITCVRMRSLQISLKGDRRWNRLAELGWTPRSASS